MLGIGLKIFAIAGSKGTEHPSLLKAIKLYPDGIGRFTKFRLQTAQVRLVIAIKEKLKQQLDSRFG